MILLNYIIIRKEHQNNSLCEKNNNITAVLVKLALPS